MHLNFLPEKKRVFLKPISQSPVYCALCHSMERSRSEQIVLLSNKKKSEDVIQEYIKYAPNANRLSVHNPD